MTHMLRGRSNGAACRCCNDVIGEGHRSREKALWLREAETEAAPGDDPCAHDSFVDIDPGTGLKQCYRCGRGFYEHASTCPTRDRA